jgi:hypothetical protein
MKVYIVDIETRKGDGNKQLGPFYLRDGALDAIVWHCGEWVRDYTEYGSDFSKGEIYTEEETILILEREII